MILLWGLPRDRPFAAVCRALEQTGQEVAVLDQRAVGETEVELLVGTEVAGTVRVPGRRIDLGAVTAAYLRPYSSCQLPSVRRAGPASRLWKHAAAVDEALWSWSELTSALVVNRPAAMASNNSKPFQALTIRSLGFDVPDTLVTTSPEAARAFWARHGEVVYKSVSGTRSIVTRLTPNHEHRLQDVRWCPTQFQQYVRGADWRVHVVGNAVFACEIRCAATDYRYAAREGVRAELHARTLPPDCADRCRRLTAAFGLAVAGVDLRRAPDGRWFCFEVNPSPGFTYYQEATGQPIDQAIATLLAAGQPEERGHNGRATCTRSVAPTRDGHKRSS
jgi:RimK-like ATP-grasp domain